MSPPPASEGLQRGLCKCRNWSAYYGVLFTAVKISTSAITLQSSVRPLRCPPPPSNPFMCIRGVRPGDICVHTFMRASSACSNCTAEPSLAFNDVRSGVEKQQEGQGEERRMSAREAHECIDELR